MKRNLLVAVAVLVITLCTGLLTPSVARADDIIQQACTSGSAKGSSVCQTNQTDDPVSGSDGIISRAIDLLSILVGVASVIVIMVAGFSFITSQGEPAALSKAKNSLVFAIIGIVIVILAQAIAAFVVREI